MKTGVKGCTRTARAFCNRNLWSKTAWVNNNHLATTFALGQVQDTSLNILSNCKPNRSRENRNFHIYNRKKWKSITNLLWISVANLKITGRLKGFNKSLWLKDTVAKEFHG